MVTRMELLTFCLVAIAVIELTLDSAQKNDEARSYERAFFASAQ